MDLFKMTEDELRMKMQDPAFRKELAKKLEAEIFLSSIEHMYKTWEASGFQIRPIAFSIPGTTEFGEKINITTALPNFSDLMDDDPIPVFIPGCPRKTK